MNDDDEGISLGRSAARAAFATLIERWIAKPEKIRCGNAAMLRRRCGLSAPSARHLEANVQMAAPALACSRTSRDNDARAVRRVKDTTSATCALQIDIDCSPGNRVRRMYSF
jgi:hypothetical protein